MKIRFLGTGTAVQVNEKAQSSILIEEEKLVMVDCGFGAMLRLSQARINVSEIDALILTHIHSDHVGELIGILKARWLEDSDKLEIYGPENLRIFIESVLESYPYLRRKLKFNIISSKRFSLGGLKVKAINAKHSIQGYAYKIEDLLISGDTRSFSELYEDVNKAIHEMSLSFGYEAVDHTTPENFVENASLNEVYFVHMYPSAFNNRTEIKKFVEKHGVKVSFAEDLQLVEL